ncbi:MAG TPA: carbohydrate porin [Candidatus Baltobacteraceae bacterium]|jgi:high affinity Mn2+ porin|nr:carbohydrate porin [Candidatus Baltobacteraceae bacterium]
MSTVHRFERHRLEFVFVTALSTITTMTAAFAQTPVSPTPSPAPTRPSPSPVNRERWSIHAQTTNLQQYHGAFPAAYSGPESLSSTADTAKTFDATLFLGARLWNGAEAYVNPEIDQGFGLNGTFGVAGFPSGEAYKVGASKPYGRLQRYFLRQTFNSGGESQTVDAGTNQLAGAEDTRHLTLTFGKFSVVDIFDNNSYAHDPRNDFMNWSILDMGAFDYAADAWGYTRGFSAESTRERSALRAGIFQLSTVPNTTQIDPHFLQQFSPVLEYERSTSLFGGHPGKVRVLGYGDYGYMAPLADATDAAAGTGKPPDLSLFRTDKHWKLGGGVNIEQEIAPHIGAFVRLSAQNGSYETFDFTEIDRSLSGGFSLDGKLWKRANDTFGIAGVVNGLSLPHQNFLAADGMGILIGDGALSYAAENILETYYRAGIGSHASITADYQYIANPAYNAARGPVSIISVRLHAER